MKKIYLIAGVTAVLMNVHMIADAGTSRSLGRGGMANARHSSANQHVGGNHLGRQVSRSNSANLRTFNTHGRESHKISDHITENGGSVTVKRQNFSGHIDVTTGKGGTFSAYGSRFSSWHGYTHKENYFSFSSEATTANGYSYSGEGQIKTTGNFAKNKESDMALEGSHSGTFYGSKTVNISASSTGDFTNTAKTIQHENVTADSLDTSNHQSSISMTKDDNNGVFVDRKETNNIHRANGNTLESSTETMITKIMDSETKVEHPNSDSQYILYNGQPIN